ncbi:MAG TPA: Na+:solute symporter, partial [Lacipirellulaceae bacterium]|nr:Na+:solute symporter [Lacipirellulaceae bacterium]
MAIHWVDLTILIGYFVGVVLLGVYLSRRAAENLDSYFLGGRSLPWYFLGLSNASGQFDISGTMWMVMLMFVYGVKSIWIPWLWPTFNQVFLMVFLSMWLRRSGALTGADWLKTRFQSGAGLELAHLSVVAFALINVVGFTAYAFIGIGKFAAIFLQQTWDLQPNTYALIIMGIASIYVILGGMYSVVIVDVTQFFLMVAASIGLALIAMSETSRETIAAVVPDGWNSLWFGWRLDLDWTGRVDYANQQIETDGYELFTPFIMMAFFKGVLASIAGPAPNYDMQRILATRTVREAALMSGLVSPALYMPRYFLVAGITVLALVYYSDTLNAQSSAADFEQLLPLVMKEFVPIGLTGLLLAGLFAAFMSTFDATVNAGAAYLVNDIYKRYFGQQDSSKRLTVMSYAGSLMVVAVGIFFGYYLSDLNSLVLWITAGLYGGYVAPNVLKWLWWRLNGAGYFAGMVAGMVLAILTVDLPGPLLELVSTERVATLAGQNVPIPALNVCLAPSFPGLYAWFDAQDIDLTPLNVFPLLLVVSGIASIVVSLLTRPDSDEVLKSFCRRVQPWGYWGPIQRKLAAEDPSYQPNRTFTRDMVNCAVGIVWQISLSVTPVLLVIREMTGFWVSLLVVAITTTILKFNWYDRLPR